MRRALMIEHDAYTRPGPVGEALARRGSAIERRLVVPAERFDTPDVEHDFPEPTDYDLIVPMGAPWSVTDHDTIGTWIAPELRMLARAHEVGIPILGICFGGQAMALALGGGIAPAPGWEIGWCTISSDDESRVSVGPWFQFHRDAMLPPPQAEVLARNRFGVQAWALGNTLAVQFHPELTAQTLRLWLDNGGDEVVRGQGQDPDQLMAQSRAAQGAAAQRAGMLIDAYLNRVAWWDRLGAQ